MIHAKRIEFTIAYPFEVEYFAQKSGLSGRFHTAFLKETKDQWITAYVRCARNDWGLNVILKINKTLNRIRGTDEFNAHVTQWLPEELKDEIIKRQKRIIDR